MSRVVFFPGSELDGHGRTKIARDLYQPRAKSAPSEGALTPIGVNEGRTFTTKRENNFLSRYRFCGVWVKKKKHVAARTRKTKIPSRNTSYSAMTKLVLIASNGGFRWRTFTAGA